MQGNKDNYDINETVESGKGGYLMDCLMTICKYHNITSSRQSLLSGLPIIDGQLSPKGFEKAASRVSLKSKTVKRGLVDINPSLLPAVLLIDGQKACVLTSLDVEAGVAEVIYPEISDAFESVNIGTLEAIYSGYVIFARPSIDYASEKSSIKNARHKHWFWGIIKEAKGLYRDVIVASFILSILSIALPLFVMNVYDRVVPNAALGTLWTLAIGVGITLFADFLLRGVRHFFVELAASRVDLFASTLLMEKVLGLAMKEKPASSGSFINNFQSFESIRAFVSSASIVALVDVPFALVFTIIIMLIDWHLAIPIFIGSIVVLLYGLFTQTTIRSLAEASMVIASRKHSLLTETISSLEDVKVFGRESKVQYEWEKQTIYLTKVNAKTRILSSTVNTVSMWVQQIVSVMIILVGVHLIVDGSMTQGSLIAAYLLSSRAMSPISQAAGLIAHYFHASAALKTLNDIMAKESEFNHDKPKNADKFQGKIEFKQVNYKYSDDGQYILNDLNLSIKAGEKIAILGKNGCGKSTINKLLLSLYQPSNGLLTIDNIDIKQYEPTFLRNNIGYVPQDIVLFSGTLRDNIFPHDRSMDESRVWKVIEKCGLLGLVNQHPDGLNQLIGERGKLLSGGQRQAIAIARAILRDPNIFILDEPTSAMDTNNELMLKKMLAQEVRGKTLILNTHRASLLDLVDRVVVIENGRVISDGDKSFVLKQKNALANSGSVGEKARV